MKSLNQLLFVTALMTAVSFASVSAHAEELDTIFKKVNEYAAQENYTKALEELAWAKKELEKLNGQKLAKLLPDEVNGFVGAPAKNSSALGMTNLERQYKSGAQTVDVSLTGGSGEGMGGLAGLARMGMMMGANQPGSDTFRIDGRTATLDTSSSSPSVTIALDSGSILKLEGSDGVTGDTLKAFAGAMKIGELDAYLKGSK